MAREEVAHVLRDAGIEVPTEELGEVAEGVAILRRLAAQLGERDADVTTIAPKRDDR